MSFDETAPFQGPDGAPNHKPLTAAIYRFANKWIKAGFDGDPPTDFIGQDDVVLQSDLDDIDFNLRVNQPAQNFDFFYRGNISVSTSDYVKNIFGSWQCVLAWAVAGDAPTTSPIDINFEYKGDLVLATPVRIPAGSDPYDPQYSVDFAVGTLEPASGLDLYRPLISRCTAADSGDTGGRVSAGLAVVGLVT